MGGTRSPISGKFIRVAIDRICINCGSDKTYMEDGKHPVWLRYNDEWICKKCRSILIDNPKGHQINSPRRMIFKNKSISLKENPRKGICSWCGRSDIRTHMHHIQYHDEDPLKDAIEICASCHMKESWRLKQLT